ncbi:hypothetical protein AB4099_34035 [Bosea sp. 2KB_26]|uniref:hypothetical protein n=1 Tax=Bosea sp. 2KB_26 TaxID=3237475 RepID=UPI003F8EA49A
MAFPTNCETPAARKAFLIHYARVLMRESAARRGSGFSHTLAEWAAAKARREASSISQAPAQRDLFEVTA